MLVIRRPGKALFQHIRKLCRELPAKFKVASDNSGSSCDMTQGK